MSTVTYRQEHTHSFTDIKGRKHSIQENILDGKKGLSFVCKNICTNKEGEKKFYKLRVKENEDKPGEFTVTENEDSKETTSVMNMSEVKKKLKSTSFTLINNYLDKGQSQHRKSLEGGAKKGSKKSSKKKSSKKSQKGGDGCDEASKKAWANAQQSQSQQSQSVQPQSQSQQSQSAPEARKV